MQDIPAEKEEEASKKPLSYGSEPKDLAILPESHGRTGEWTPWRRKHYSETNPCLQKEGHPTSME